MAFLDYPGLTRFKTKMQGWINSIIGDTDMGTTADTLTGAIAEHSAQLEDLEAVDPVESVNGTMPDENGNVQINRVDYADQLVADDAQASFGEFIARTTGGDASLSDGDAWLSGIKGARVHTGYVADSLQMTVNAAEREVVEGESATTITATIDRDTFVSNVSTSGTYTLTYDGSAWSASPAFYGVTVTGTPIEDDEIVIVYVAEVRGTITVATPTAFTSTGWNLYNHTNGYARVLNYSQNYGFIIGGSYTAVQFSETLTGAKTTITPVDGAFSVPSDGYVWVTGGDSTSTYICMTWSDWTSGPSGSFAAYTESTISLSTIMANFPNGLLQVGSVRDEIDFNIGVATSNIERMAYSAANLATAKASGRAYEYDQNYIYIVRETPVTYAVSVDASYTASDHGMEFFAGTDCAVYASMFYGQNLKDKLRTDVVQISSQSLTSAQQAQVRTNIGAASDSDLSSLSDHIANVINPGGLSNNERYLPANLGTVNASNIADFVSSYGLSTGNYKDIYPGCYITIPDSVANTQWMVAGLGFKHNKGNTANGHGGEFIPRGAGFAYGTQMNSTNTTAGGYKGSAMFTYLAETFTPAMQSIIGTHLLKQRILVSNAVDTAKASQYSGYTGMASNWEWADAYAALMSEVEVYGSSVWGGPFDVGEACAQLPVFRFISPVEFGRGYFWLRAVASSSYFANCRSDGAAGYDYASTTWLYVRPLIRIG